MAGNACACALGTRLCLSLRVRGLRAGERNMTRRSRRVRLRGVGPIYEA